MTSRPGSQQLRLALVDDHEVILGGLRDFLSREEDIEVAFEARSAEEALTAIQDSVPDVAILDVRLPDMDGVTLCREIRANYPSVRCLMFSSFTSDETVMEAVVAGASGFILKDAELSEFIQAVRDVGRGRSLIDPSTTQRVLERLHEHREKTGLEDLTPQERKILDLMAQGMSNRDISAELFLAEQTVKNYVSNVLSKLGMQRRTQAAIFAVNLERDGNEDAKEPGP